MVKNSIRCSKHVYTLCTYIYVINTEIVLHAATSLNLGVVRGGSFIIDGSIADQTLVFYEKNNSEKFCERHEAPSSLGHRRCAKRAYL